MFALSYVSCNIRSICRLRIYSFSSLFLYISSGSLWQTPPIEHKERTPFIKRERERVPSEEKSEMMSKKESNNVFLIRSKILSSSFRVVNFVIKDIGWVCPCNTPKRLLLVTEMILYSIGKTIIYLLLSVRFTLFFYSFDLLGCSVWLWLLTYDTKWSFRFLCFILYLYVSSPRQFDFVC